MMHTMITTLEGICQTWNDACTAVNKQPKVYDKMLQRLQSVSPTAISHRKPPAEAVQGKTDTGCRITILAAGHYHCTCDAFTYTDPDGGKFPCKHICVIASHALLHLYSRDSK